MNGRNILCDACLMCLQFCEPDVFVLRPLLVKEDVEWLWQKKSENFWSWRSAVAKAQTRKLTHASLVKFIFSTMQVCAEFHYTLYLSLLDDFLKNLNLKESDKWNVDFCKRIRFLHGKHAVYCLFTCSARDVAIVFYANFLSSWLTYSAEDRSLCCRTRQ